MLVLQASASAGRAGTASPWVRGGHGAAHDEVRRGREALHAGIVDPVQAGGPAVLDQHEPDLGQALEVGRPRRLAGPGRPPRTAHRASARGYGPAARPPARAWRQPARRTTWRTPRPRPGQAAPR